MKNQTKNKEKRRDYISDGMGYNFITDGETGKTLAIDRETGECIEAENRLIIKGSNVYTPQSQRNYKERKEAEKKQKEAEEKKKYFRQNNLPLGQFYFVPTDEQFEGLKPETVTRLIYLNTYVGYDDNDKLTMPQGSPITVDNLPKVLGVSRTTAYRFLKEVSPAYLVERDGRLCANKDIFKKGKIKPSAEHERHQMLYLEGI